MKIEKVSMLDITSPKVVEVRISADGKVLWINVDEICVLRCCQIKVITVDDERKP